VTSPRRSCSLASMAAHASLTLLDLPRDIVKRMFRFAFGFPVATAVQTYFLLIETDIFRFLTPKIVCRSERGIFSIFFLQYFFW
jgi:hypothetical protein